MSIISSVKTSIAKWLTNTNRNEEFTSPNVKSNETGRGYQVYFTSELLKEYARDKSGNMVMSTRDEPYFVLSPEQRVKISQFCTPVLGIVSSRMNRISAKKFIVTSDKEQEDLIVDRMRDINNLIKEYQNVTDKSYIIARARLIVFLRERLFDLKPDLSNFDACLLRWSKGIKYQKKEVCDQIKSWLEQPNQNDTWQDFVKQWIYDEMIHGASAIYKQSMNNKLENMTLLPGGTVLPIRDKYVTTKTAYLQIIPNQTPLMYYSDELIFNRYLPISCRSYGIVPLEALVNKVAESLLFDKLMAEQADGTKLPEKMVLITENNMFGDETVTKLPISKGEQKRIEKKVNTPLKGGVMTFSGNNVAVIDLTRENTMGIQMQRQKDIREDVALVYNMTSMEVNLTGSEDVSGRQTAEQQAEIEQGKGTLPMMAMMEYRLNKEAIPFRVSASGYSVTFQSEKNEKEELEKWRTKLATGLFSVNQILVEDLNRNPFDKEEFNYPPNSQMTPDGSKINPFNFKNME